MDLPNEIIREICSRPELEKKDLRALRLICKHLCEFTSKRFARESFSRVTVLMTRPSLRAFIELSQHPYFGSVVKEINISPMSAPYDGLAGLPELHVLQSTDTGHPGYSLGTIEVLTTYQNRSRKEAKLRADGGAERMLSVAFNAFAQRNQGFELQFCQYESDAIGAIDLMHNKSLGHTKAWRLDWTTTIQQTMRAVTSQGCNITALLINESARQDCVNDSGLCTDEIRQQLGAFCSKLARLKIWLYHMDHESTLRSVKRMVSTAENLKTLNLMKVGEWDPYHLPDVLECVTSTTLETVVIAEWQMWEPELEEFLIEQRNTLQELQLLGGCLTLGSCRSLVAWIRDNLPHLVRLELWEICDAAGHENCSMSEYKSYNVQRGENMQLWLARILDGTYERDVVVKDEDVDSTERVEESEE
jgi:hypothetical protein